LRPFLLFKNVGVKMYTKSGHIEIETLLKQYQPLVQKIANHLKFRLPENVEVDDLIQV